jgi:hypothetical protein
MLAHWQGGTVGIEIPQPPPNSPPYPGDLLAPFTFSGESWSPGKVTVITCFAYWCDTWKTQIERLREAENTWRGLPVDSVAITVDPRWIQMDSGTRWTRRMVDSGSVWSTARGIDRVPYVLVVDTAGRVTYASYGISRSADLVRAVRRALEIDNAPTGGALYLTFDDFPARSGNSELLEVLQRTRVSATFFVIGENALSESDLLRRAVSEGHQLGIHGWSHRRETADPERLAKWLRDGYGVASPWVRLPGSSAVSRDGKGFEGPVVNPYDYNLTEERELLRRMLYALKPGAVIQLHTGVPTTRKVLPFFVMRARELGYEFERLPE